MIKLQAHRGVSAEYPENTMTAFIAAVEQGYEAIELDVAVTKDQKFVLLHDNTINRTARKADGSPVGASLPVNRLTYEELLEYDFGLYRCKKFAGTKIPLLTDVLELAKKNNVQIKIDSKYRRMTAEQKAELFSLIHEYEDVVALTVNDLEALAEARAEFPNMQLHYDMVYSVETIHEVAKLVPSDKITFWFPYPNERTSFATVPFINEELAKEAKKYGSLAVWNLANYEELEKSIALGADIAETNGQVKHEMRRGVLADMHTHSEHSHDAKFPIRELVDCGIENGVKVVAITDHCDIFLCEDDRELDVYTNIREAAEEVDKLNEEYGNRCLILRGVELGDGIWHPDISQKVTDMLDYDVVVGGTHAVKCLATTDGVGMKHAFSQLKYNELPKELFDDLMKNYFDDIMTMVTTQDIDIMAHIICPLGYPLHRHKIYVDARPYEKKIEAVLKEVIKRGIAFEANPMLFEVIDGEMPYLWIVEKFRDLGGHLFTFSTDAHSPKGVGADFARRVQIMKDLGFRNVFYFKNRRAVPCAL